MKNGFSMPHDLSLKEKILSTVFEKLILQFNFVVVSWTYLLCVAPVAPGPLISSDFFRIKSHLDFILVLELNTLAI